MSIAVVIYGIVTPALMHYMKSKGGLTNHNEDMALRSYLDDQTSAIVSMFLSIPIMALTIGIKAKVRGEKKQLWTYGEEWAKKVPTTKKVVNGSEVNNEVVEEIQDEKMDLEENGESENTPLISLEEAIKS